MAAEQSNKSVTLSTSTAKTNMLNELTNLLTTQSIRNIVLLSPHLDDVALSIGGSVYNFPPQTTCTLVTVFSSSGYAPGCPDLSDVAEVTRMRHQEEQRYAKQIGAQLILLDFPDTSLLGYSEEQMQGDCQTDERFAAVCAAVNQSLTTLQPDLIFAPLALGDHIDHKMVFEAVQCSQYAQAKRPILYYEDLPYAWYYTETALLAEIETKFAAKVEPLCADITAFTEQKRNNILLYPSQIPPNTFEEGEKSIFDYAMRVHTQAERYAERLWIGVE